MKFSLALLSLLGSLALCHADAVRLKISGPDGKPVANANVRVMESTGNWRTRASLPPVTLTSDQTGAVAFESKKPMQKAGPKGQPPVAGSYIFATVRAAKLAAGALWIRPGDNALVLQEGQTLEGIALDAAQKPVVGAHLRVTTLPPQPNDPGEGSSTGDDPLFEAITASDGHYRIEALPRRGNIKIQVDDPLWQKENFELDLARKAPPLFLERGATIKGRMLRPDGTPAKGVRFDTGDFAKQSVTRADGTFEVTGLEEGYVYFQLTDTDQNLSFVVPPLSLSDLKAGEVRDIGDWKTQTGVHARGRIIAADTRKPLSGASVSLWGGGDAQGQTNAQGAFDIPLIPGSRNATVRADGFVALIVSGVNDPKGDVIDMGTIELVRGKPVSGVLLDEKGNPLLNRSLLAHKKRGNTGDEWADTGVGGKFSFSGLDVGDYTILGQGFKITGGNQFSVGNNTAPPSLRPIAEAGMSATMKVEQTVTGHVESADGTGVAGARISLRLMLTETSWVPKEVLSQVGGGFSATFSARGKIKVIAVKRPGFILRTSEVLAKNSDWNITIKMQPRGTALRGRVVDATGKAVAGAFVALKEGSAPPVAADANGNFALEDAPLENVTLLASNGPAFASFEVKQAAQKVEIVLPDSPPVENKSALADTLLQNGFLDYGWTANWDILGQKRIETLIRQKGFGDGRGGNTGWAWGQYLEVLATRNPQDFLLRESELRAATSADITPVFEHFLMLCRATIGTEEQKELVRTWLTKQEKVQREPSALAVDQLLGLAEISARLDPKSAQTWLDYAAQIADQLPDSGGENAWRWSKVVARVQKDAPLNFGDGWKPTVQLMLLNSAMESYQATSDLASALLVQQRAPQLLEQATKNPEADMKLDPHMPRPSDLVRQTTAIYARILSRTDPAAALALVPSLEQYEQLQLDNAIARNAIKLKQFDAAKKAIEASFLISTGNVEFYAEAATIAQSFDPAFAATLWPRAYQKTRPRPEDEGQVGFSSFVPYAANRAQNWPGESRILLEREWKKRVTEAPPAEENADVYMNNKTLVDIVNAMADVSPARAIEMLSDIPQTESLRNKARLAIAVALLNSLKTKPPLKS